MPRQRSRRDRATNDDINVALRRVGLVALAIVIAATGIWFYVSPYRCAGSVAQRTMAAQDCAARYARAVTAADTAIVDAVDVGGKFVRILCADIRLNQRGLMPPRP